MSEFYIDDTLHTVRIDPTIPFQMRESHQAVDARINRMAERGVLIARVIPQPEQHSQSRANIEK